MRYKLIKQGEFYCVPGCLQAVFDRHNIPYDTQDRIAKELGFRNDSHYQGTQVQKEQYSIEKYLTKHHIPLKFSYIFDLDYDSTKKYIEEYTKGNKDIIACYRRGVMFGKKLIGGHAAIVEKISGDIIALVYPNDKSGFREVSLKSLIKAIQCHGKENMAGLWLFEKSKELL